MKNSPDDLKPRLFSAKDGSAACHTINKLAKLAEEGDEQAKDILALYTSQGAIDHIRTYACTRLAKAVTEPHVRFAELFRHGLTDPDLRYWSILGYVNSAGRSAYEDLVRMAEDSRIPLADRAQAVKCLARFSGQPFDRHLPSDPGYWKETDLRLPEISAWATNGYPDGKGYRQPSRDPALDQPATDFEKVISRLDKKLAKKRQDRQDLADPTDWLTPATSDELQRVKARWNLPATYLDFLTRFSPIKVVIQSQRFYNGGLWLFGASELIDAQEGYSFNPIDNKPLEDRPAHLVVIAHHGGDPFVLDLSKSDGTEAPVDTAEHDGVGIWEFGRVAKSFRAFLGQLAK